MYAKYGYLPNSTDTTILADIKKILTGTTDKALLSADCDPLNTYINSDVGTPAGWVDMLDSYTNIYQGRDKGGLPGNYYSDVAFNGTVFCAIAGGGHSSFPSNGCAVSSDGVTWVQATMPTNTYWSRIVWNGTVFCAVAGSAFGGAATTVAATSPDGITWTPRTLASQVWGGLAVGAAGLLLALPKGGFTNAYATSADNGVTWTARTLPVSAYWGDVGWNGTVFCVVSGVNTSTAAAYTSPDGITWTARTLPSPQLWSSIAWNGTVFCVVSGTAVAATSPDGIIWTQRTLPVTQSWGRIAAVAGVFYAAGGFCTNAYTINIGAFSFDNGVTWIQFSLQSARNCRGIASGLGKVLFVGNDGYSQLISTVASIVIIPNAHLKALNADGTTYKYLNVAVMAGGVKLTVAELLAGNVTTNLANTNNLGANTQPLDMVNGGILYLAASARYCLMLSYNITSAVFGLAGTATFCGVCEYSRDDLWNTDYPPYVQLSGSNLTACYPPRLKSGIGLDVTGATAVLSLQPSYAMTKQILNGTGTQPIHSAVELRLSNTTNYIYSVLGGVILGGIKRTTDSIGLMTDETVLNTKNYVVWTGGVVNPAFRLIVPKF